VAARILAADVESSDLLSGTFVVAVQEGFEAAKKFFTIEPEAIRIRSGSSPLTTLIADLDLALNATTRLN
jgi:hypothetical protein